MTGAMRWVQTLTWPGLDHYNSADRLTVLNPDTQLTEAFVKAHDRLKFYWILGAGHSVGGLPYADTHDLLVRLCNQLTHRPTHAETTGDF